MQGLGLFADALDGPTASQAFLRCRCTVYTGFPSEGWSVYSRKAVKPCRSRRCSLVSTPSQPGHAHVHQGPGTGAAGLAARILGKSSWMMCMSSISQMRAWCSGARVVQRLQGSLATSCKSVLRSQGGCCREIEGSEKKNVAPCPTAASAHIRPA